MVSKNKDFKIKEYHVIETPTYEDEYSFRQSLWLKLKTFTSLSEAIKYARKCKEKEPESDCRVLGEFNYEEI